MISYTPPTAHDLQTLKNQLGYTGEQMAELVNVAGSQQWRKYTGGEQPRSLSLHQLFFMAARMTLSTEELERVRAQMRALGAEVSEIKKQEKKV
ncbi:XRE family transcriptional regulator [Corticibacter populi]|uniref:XRE family transcriptional regulator n=1 Tax=Corticibacter populi TaxID=1550736 RepID=A0A3M6QUJ1_9BURK|nr:XRE family transcriptional regulator [Corticibacter populi]RMX06696.1 XRE family transcriptional regulator [Corticibacter populi]RZS31723.1 hypothetical protein EV687_2393 [Corticibacter populi]